MLRQVLAGQEERDAEAVRAFVLRACLMHLHFTKFPAIAELLAGLRYRVEVRRSPETRRPAAGDRLGAVLHRPPAR